MNQDARDQFVRVAVWHGSLDEAERVRMAYPNDIGGDLYTAALLGDDARVRRIVEDDPAAASRKGGALGWDPLTYLCFSKYLRLDRSRRDAFWRAAEALLTAGASANTGFWEQEHRPEPEWESALYGAAGVAQDAALTRLLLAHGADPNDEEVPYHAPETRDNGAVQALLDSGKLNADSLATLLVRKADWHDAEGMRLVLAHSADPNRMTRWKHTALHWAVKRDNALPTIELLLAHGADPLLPNGENGRSAAAMAARRGRGDVLALLHERGIAMEFRGVERLMAACACDTEGPVESQEELRRDGGSLLAEFAANGNTAGVARLLDLGVTVDAVYRQGDAYFGVARMSTALHAAAWRAQHDTVQYLLQRGAPVNARDGEDRTPLMLAVRACVDSYWTARRAPASVQALLDAGAVLDGVRFPSGYDAVDELLATKMG